MVTEKEAPPSSFGVAGMEGLGGSAGGVMGSVFGSGGPKVQAAAPKKVNISAGVAVGMLLQKTTPVYPPIAKAARVSGTVVCRPQFPRPERSKTCTWSAARPCCSRRRWMP